ncbi:MAG: bifunctional aspartate kinase/homoserine dehydrogenase I, partial [Bacteroidota bacterium]|nr:bifunctional aspartate kinase/homoserine dehydrogenase I [Bacteroidota bacterium]
MKVLKFGGAAVISPESFHKMKEIVLNEKESVVVVVSAVHGITDSLLQAAVYAASFSSEYQTELSEIRTCHLNLINQLFDKNEAKERNNEFENLFSELERYIKGISMVGELTPALQDR